MNTSPWLEIIVALAVVLFISFLIGNYVYRRKHHLPTGECACCGKANLVKNYHKAYKKK